MKSVYKGTVALALIMGMSSCGEKKKNDSTTSDQSSNQTPGQIESPNLDPDKPTDIVKTPVDITGDNPLPATDPKLVIPEPQPNKPITPNDNSGNPTTETDVTVSCELYIKVEVAGNPIDLKYCVEYPGLSQLEASAQELACSRKISANVALVSKRAACAAQELVGRCQIVYQASSGLSYKGFNLNYYNGFDQNAARQSCELFHGNGMTSTWVF